MVPVLFRGKPHARTSHCWSLPSQRGLNLFFADPCPLLGTGFGVQSSPPWLTFYPETRSLMRITHSPGERLVVLSDAEAASVVEVCALLVIASQSTPQAALPPHIATVLHELFVGLKAPVSSLLTSSSEATGAEP